MMLAGALRSAAMEIAFTSPLPVSLESAHRRRFVCRECSL